MTEPTEDPLRASVDIDEGEEILGLESARGRGDGPELAARMTKPEEDEALRRAHACESN